MRQASKPSTFVRSLFFLMALQMCFFRTFPAQPFRLIKGIRNISAQNGTHVVRYIMKKQMMAIFPHSQLFFARFSFIVRLPFGVHISLRKLYLPAQRRSTKKTANAFELFRFFLRIALAFTLTEFGSVIHLINRICEMTNVLILMTMAPRTLAPNPTLNLLRN